MKFDPVFLLVVLAVLLMVFLPVFVTGRTISKRLRSRKRRKIVLGQLTIVVLLLATVATLTWPVHTMNSLIQGILLSCVVLVPAFVLNILVSLHYSSVESEAALAVESEMDAWTATREDFHLGESNYNKNKSGRFNTRIENDSIQTANEPIDFGTDSIPVVHLPAEPDWSDGLYNDDELIVPDIQLLDARLRKPLTNAAALSGIPKPFPDTENQIEPVVKEQLERVSEFVQSHDLGEEDTISLHEDVEGNSTSEDAEKTSQSPSPQFSEMTLVDSDSSELELIDKVELTGMVTSLQKDNGRLQKLVIAQHAVIESQREAYDRSRDVARDAVKIMQDAQSNQRVAEKIARREKSERQRIQKEYQKVTSVFENAMSIISVNKETSSVKDGA